MKFSIKHKVTFGFAASVLALIGMGWLTYHTATSLIATEFQFTYAYKVIATLEAGRSILTDAETAQRGYLLTGDEQFLKDCTNAQAQVSGWIDKLRKYTADEPEQQQRLAKIEPLVKQRLALLNDRIELRRQKGLQAVASAVATREGKALMDQVQQGISEMHIAENITAFQRQKDVQTDALIAEVAIWSATLVACVIGLAALLFIRRDLRLRERAEAELERFFSLSLDFLCIASSDGYFKRVSPAVTDILGWSVEEFQSRPFISFVHPDDHAATLHEVEKQMVSGEKVLRFENRYQHKDGSWRVLSWRSIPHGGLMYATARDVTAEQATQKALRESEARYRTLFDSIDEGFCIIQMIFDEQENPVDYRFLAINPSFEKQTGLRDALGRTMRELAPQHEAHWFEIYGRIAMTGEPARFQNRAEQLHRTYDVYAFRFGEPGERQVAILFNDITQSKAAEAQIIQLNADLRQRAVQLETANKELEAFSYSVSHDLRAPLRHIDGFVGLLDKQAAEKLDARGQRYLKIIAESARQMGALIDDLLVFSRMGRAELRQTKVDLNSLVDEALSGLQAEVNGRRVEWKIQRLPQVQADPAMMRQVIVNLVANAIKYTRPRDPAIIEIGCEQETSDDFVFYVRDNGVGFDMQYVEKLFGVFQRLHHSDEFEGTGIGLANVRRIIYRHGGRTWAEGKVDSGATFYYTLPKQLGREG